MSKVVEIEQLYSVLACSGKAFLSFNREGLILHVHGTADIFAGVKKDIPLTELIRFNDPSAPASLFCSDPCKKEVILYQKDSGAEVSATYQRLNDDTHLLIADFALNASKLSEMRYEFLFRNSVAGIFRTKPDGEIVHVNDAYVSIFGFDTKEELKAHRSSEFYIDPKDREQFLSRLREEKELKNCIIRNCRKDGEPVYLLTNATLTLENGVEYIDGILVDVSELKKQELQIEEQHERLQMLERFLEQTTEAIQVCDKNGKFVYMNEVARKRLGMKKENYTNYSVFDIESYFKTKEQWAEELEFLKTKGVRAIEGTNKNVETGKKIPVEISVSYLEINDKPYTIASIRDITLRKSYEKKIEEANRFLKVLNLAIDTGSLVTETDIFGNITYVNEKFCEISQYSQEELIGKNHSIVNSGYHSKEFWADFWNTIRQNKIWSGEICNRSKDGSLYWVRTLIYPVQDDNGAVLSYLSVRQDITSEKSNEEKLHNTLEFQNLILGISNRFVNIPLEKFEVSVNESLKEIGEFVGSDRVYIFSYDHQAKTSSNDYEWCADGIEAQIDNFKGIPISEIKEWSDFLFANQMINITDVSQLPDTKFKEMLTIQDIQSVLAIPMFSETECIGFIGFDAVRKTKTFEERDIVILKLFAEMLVNIQARISSIHDLELANKEIERINQNLEIEVFQKRRENSKLTMMLSEHEKLAMLGEIAAGVAHDLNTPLGSIKVGIESVRYTLEGLFHSVIEKCSTEQLHAACERAQLIESDLILGGLQTMKETKAIQEVLQQKNYQGDLESSTLASAIVKARIKSTESDLITTVLAQPNPIEYLDLMYHIQTIRTLVDTIIASGDKASSVVSNLRSYLQNSASEDRKQIDLSASIQTIIKVFGHEIKNKAVMLFNVPQVFLDAYENKLYQLWSNIIKNAIEAIDDNGTIEITYEDKGEFHSVSIRNNGPKIAPEVLDNMFKKFYTTKQNQKGTGLGLSIVKRIVNDHNGQIYVTSDDDWTSFEILLPKLQEN
jgi:PAS domain S-box-containing protein